MIEIVPCELRDANAFVREHHRHHPPVVGHKFSVAAWTNRRTISCCTIWHDDFPIRLGGVAIIGRPVARGLQDGLTLEVTRLATDGTAHLASKMYAACWNGIKALGYRRLVTYTLRSEKGSSLRAAGWKIVAEVSGRSWNCKSRPRLDVSPTQDKFRWEPAYA